MENEKSSVNLFGVFLLLLAVLIVAGLYTFYNAKGMSYLSDDPQACNNCHIMNDVFNDYVKAPHSKKVAGKPRASCNDCHLPHDFVGKWVAKAKSGVGHAYSFTFKLDDLPAHLSATNESKQIVQNNCMSCHAEMATHAISATTKVGADNALSCVSCHAGVGHTRGF